MLNNNNLQKKESVEIEQTKTIDWKGVSISEIDNGIISATASFGNEGIYFVQDDFFEQ